VSTDTLTRPPESETLPVAAGEFTTHVDGVYFGLDETTYHADPALGSTDIKRLENTPEDYWFSSGYNPALDDDGAPTNAQLFGRAMHKMVLEGREAFDRDYAPFDGDLRTKEGKAAKAEIEERGQTLLKYREWERIVFAGTIIRSNPYLAEAFSGGQPEVSVFWTDTTEDGFPIRKKARFDYLKTRAICDLKSIRNTKEIEFPTACLQAIATWKYHVQATHYRRGRIAMGDLVRRGHVFGEVDREWLKGVVDQGEEFAWVWVFYQAEGAPLTWGGTLSPGNPIYDIGKAQIEKAEYNFARFFKNFGVETPWLEAKPLAEVDISELPGWFGR
jgi:hypothetical protein